jgi:hypothetical protein
MRKNFTNGYERSKTMRWLGFAGLVVCVVLLIRSVFAHPVLNSFLLVTPYTTSDTFSYAHSGRLVTNPAATGTLTFDLPPAAPGMHFIFAVATTQKIAVNPDDNDVFIGLLPTLDVGDAIESDTVVGTLIEIVAIDSTNWLQIRKAGTWADIDP